MMRRLLAATAVASVANVATAAPKASSSSSSVSVTPHDSYSSSIGVLGCKIDTNRVAYWPETVTCDNICVSLTHDDRQLYLLRIDQSAGAHDISYDAWNYLYTGKSATDKPVAGGGVDMTYEAADPSKCKSLIKTKGSKLPLSAANSMNYLSDCLSKSDSWVAKNYELFNVLDPICTMGYDEECKLDWPAKNQAACPHTLGIPEKLKDSPVYNIRYPTGEKVLAGAPDSGGADGESSAAMLPGGASLIYPVAVAVMIAAFH